MIRKFDYRFITLEDIDINNHLIFICDGDDQKVILEKESE